MVAEHLRNDLPVRKGAGTSEDREAARFRNAGRFEGPGPAVFLVIVSIGITIARVVRFWMRGPL